MDFETSKQLEAAFREMLPSFDGKETEQNWQQRDRNVSKLKKITAGNAPQDLTAAYLSGIKLLLDGILKTVNSLRTTLSSIGCSLVQDVANASGQGIDNMVEILLQNFIKLCANTKPISRTNANDTVLAILSNVSYHHRLAQHIHLASQDKNLYPRRFACSWLKKIIKKHPRHVIEHAGGLDLIEKSLKAGLLDRDKDVREAMRPTFWAFARRWPEKSDGIMSGLDKIKQDQLLADDSNPNKVRPDTNAANSAVEEPAKFSKSTSSVPVGKPSLKEVKARLAAQKKAELQSDRPNSAQAFVSQRMEEPTPGKKKTGGTTSDHKSGFSKSVTASTDGKPSLKDLKARTMAQKKAQAPGEIHSAGEPTANRRTEAGVLGTEDFEEAFETQSDALLSTAPGQITKSSLKDVKTKLIAQKKVPDNEQSGSLDNLVPRGPIDARRSPEKGGFLDHKKSRSRLDHPSGGILSPGSQGPPFDDLVTLPTISRPATQKKSSHSSERPRSADAPTPQLKHQSSSAMGKVGNLTSAPMRPRRRPVARKPEASHDPEPGQTDTIPLDLGTSQDLGLQADLKLRSEPLREGEIPDGDLLAEKAIREPDEPSKQELFKLYESNELLKQHSTVEKIESPLHCLKLLESAQVRIQARSLDIHGFRKLQTLIREQGSNATIWQDGYKIEELLLPLLEWIELPLLTPTESDLNYALDLNTQILVTIRLILKNHRSYAKAFFAQSMCSLLVSRDHFTGKEHIVSGLEETVSFIVTYCSPKECMKAICDMIEHDLGSRAYELALHTLSSLLHRLHRAPHQGGFGQQFTQGDENLARRLGRITTALLEDKDLVTRRAAIEVALEFYYCVPEEDFFKLITRKNENHRNVLLYYLSRHKKVHDQESE